MNILLFNHYATPPDSPNSTRHYDLGRQIVRMGHRVTIVAGSFSHLSKRERVAAGEKMRRQEVDGVEFVWLRTPVYSGNGFGRIWSMVVYMWHALVFGCRAAAPDVVVGSSVHPFAALAGWAVSKRHRKQFVFEVRDLWPQTLIDLGAFSRYHPFILLLTMLERFLFRVSSRIITLLPGAGNYMVRVGADPGKIVYIPNGVDLEAFDENRARQEFDGFSARDAFHILYTGALGFANGMETLIEAARIVRDSGDTAISFVIIGEGTAKTSLMQLSQKYGLLNVVFMEPVPKTMIASVLDKADAFCVVLKDSPLYQYGISLNKLFDYLAGGKPILFAGNPSNNPVGDSGAGICVPAEDPKALAKAALQLRDMNVGLRAAMGEAGRRYVEKFHDTRYLAERYLETLGLALGAEVKRDAARLTEAR